MKKLCVILASVLFLSACSGGGSSSQVVAPLNTDGNPSVAAKSTNLAVGDTDCPYGGILVQTGIDANKNGLLDTTEVSSSQKVCNGASGANGTNGTNGTSGTNGTNALVKLTQETSGANCAAGGVRIDSGTDTNRNGALDSSETTSTSYTCNGATGAAGAGASWVNVTGTTQQAVSNTGYLANSSSQVTITLPASPSIGDIVQVSGVGTGGWKIIQNPGQNIVTTSIGGSVYVTEKTLLSSIPVGTSSWGITGIVSSSDGSKLAVPVSGGQIYTSSDYGATWTPRGPSLSWYTIASSADGSKLVATGGQQIYTSSDSGITWTQQGPSLGWQSVASSSDGSKLVAVVSGGQIYTSSDYGATWTPTGPTEYWMTVASSSDGSKLVAATSQQIYTSSDSGITWIPNAPSLNWATHNGSSNYKTVALSSDGNTIISATTDAIGGQIHTSHNFGITWTTYTPSGSLLNFDSIASSSDGSKIVVGDSSGKYLISPAPVIGTVGTAKTHAAISSDGSKMFIATQDGKVYSVSSSYALVAIYGNQYDSIELQYIGNNTFNIIGHEGNLTFN